MNRKMKTDMFKFKSATASFLFRLITYLIVVSIIIMTLFNYYSQMNGRKKIRSQKYFQAERFVDILSLPLWNYDLQTIDNYLEIITADRDLCKLELFDSNKSLIAEQENHTSYDISPGNHFSISIPVTHNETQIGHAVFTYTYSHLNRRNLILSLLTSGFLILFLVVIIVTTRLTFRKYFLSPLEHLIEGINEVSSGQFTSQLDITPQKEFKEIVERFNTMATKIKSRENQLNHAYNSLKTIQDTIPDAFFLHDLKGSIVQVNDTFSKMYGYSSDDIANLSVADFSASGYTQEMAEKHIQEAAEKHETQFRWMARHKNGTVFPVEVRLKKIKLSGSDFVMAIVSDLTEKVRFEKDLEEEKEKLKVTLHSIGDGVIATGQKGNVILINPAAQSMTGVSESKASKKTISEILNIVHSETEKPLNDIYEKILKEGHRLQFLSSVKLISRNGKETPVAVSASPIVDKDNSLLGIVFVLKDMSQQIKVEEEMERNRKLESVGLLAGGIAHDFNNILTSIIGNLEIASLKVQDNEYLKLRLDEATKASFRARDLSNQLLTFSKGGTPVIEETSVETILREVTEFILSGSRVSCRFNVENNLWSGIVDPGQINQVIQNIVLNAKQAMPDGGMLEVQANNENISYHPVLKNGDYIHILIKDNGIGIPEKYLNKVFDPYFTTKEKGHGLGLATVFSIIQKHQGHISVKSDQGKGTEFNIYLPATSRKQVIESKESEALSLKQSGHILIMDDDESILDVIDAILTHLNFSVSRSKHGEEAVQLYSEKLSAGTPFDCVILDLTIPGGMGGLETLKQLKALDPNVVAIVSSGYSYDNAMADYKGHGFRGMIAKPYNIKSVEKVMLEILN